jgi:hypothetical protein
VIYRKMSDKRTPEGRSGDSPPEKKRPLEELSPEHVDIAGSSAEEEEVTNIL